MGRAEDIQHTLIVGTIAQTPAEDQAKVKEAAAKLREMLAEGDDPYGNAHAVMAFALVGSEMARAAP